MKLLLLAISAALVNNVVLSQFLGLCPFLGVSKKINTSVGMSGAVIVVITAASAICSAIYQFILSPLNLTYLNTIVFILVIASLVQFMEMFIKKYGHLCLSITVTMSFSIEATTRSPDMT